MGRRASTPREPGSAKETGLAEAELHAVLASTMDAVIAIDESYRIILFNQAAEKMFGCVREDALGSSINRFIPERHHREHDAAIRRFEQSGLTSRRLGALKDVVALRQDGMEFPVEASISRADVSGRKIFSVILRDVTEQRASERAVRLLAALVASSDDAILSEDLDGKILSWNRGAERMYGYAAREMVGRSISVLVPEERRHEITRITARIRNGERMERLQTVRVAKDGRRLDVALSISPIRDHRGEIIGASVIARDLTAELENLRALREAERKVQIAQELASIGTLTAGLAHEVGTPMSVILGHAQMMEASATDEGMRETARIIGDQVRRITGIIHTLLNIARPGPRQSIPVDLCTIVDDARSFLSEKLSHRRIVFERNLEGVGPVTGDPERLQQLLLNLFVNAADAMPEGGVLSVALRAKGNREVELRVRDTGPGIPKEILPQIFEPFFTTKHRGKGSGLGLAVCKGIVADHGGEIEVQSEPGAGTEFCIRLPLLQPAAPEPA